MRLTILFLFVGLMQVSASLFSQNTKLSLDFRNTRVADVLEAIENQSEFRFAYSAEYIDVNRKVDIDMKGRSIDQALSTLFNGTDVRFKINDRHIMLFQEGLNPALTQQQKMLSGKVSDNSGGALPGVTVIIKGTTLGTITDSEGNFSISDVPAEAIVSFSFVGMKPQEIKVGNKTTLNVVLEEETIGIDEVVAIGYGTAKKSTLTGSIASVQGKDLAAYPVANAAQAMQGRVAGVTVTAVDGRPDAKVSIRIRGGGSITQSNDPLFIVDGFPVSNINDIPASQIQSIDILKDASSTAIYGARGANGVVLVTTKSPVSGKITISYDGNYQIKTPSKYLGMLDNYDFIKVNWDFSSLWGSGLDGAWAKAYGLGDTYKSLNPGGIDAYKNAPRRDLEKEVIRTAYAQNHNVTVSGGNDKTKYSISLDNLSDDGIKIQSYYKRTNVLAKLKSEIAKNLTLDLDLTLSNQQVFGNEDQSSVTGSMLTRALRFTPITPLGDISGGNTQLGLYDNYVRPQYDPIGQINDVYDRTDRQRLRVNTSLTWQPISGLTLRSEYGLSRGYSSQYFFRGAFAKSTVGVEGGDATITKTISSRYRLVNTANYTFKEFLGQNHHLDLLIGQEINGTEQENTVLTGTRYPVAFDYKRAFAMMNQYGNQNEVRISNLMDDPGRLASIFGRVNYDYQSKYLFTATLRADGSSNFSPTNRWGYFPAAAAAWRISEEPFLKGSSVIDNLKLRLSYGQVGNDQISSGLWKSEWAAQSAGYPYANVGNSYYQPASTMMINPDLKWETTITRNLGIDYAFFGSRIYGTIDTYWNTVKNLLMVNTLPAYTGYTTQMANVGQTRNRGIEVSIGGDIVRQKDFKLSANLNVSVNRGVVESLTGDETSRPYNSGTTGYSWASNGSNPINDYIFKVGEPVGLIHGYMYDGFYTTADFDYNATTKVYTLKSGVANSVGVMGSLQGLSGVYPGMLKLKKIGSTLSATNINETDDAVVIGNTNPDFTGGLNINASYKSFDLMLGFNWSYGNDIYNANKLANSYGNKLPFRNFSSYVTDWYTLFKIDAGNIVRVYDPTELAALNVNAKYAMPFNEVATIHSGAIEDGSFLRLNNVTLGYTLPSQITKKILIQNLRVYTTITNAWLWTNYSGYDPEVDAGNGRNSTYPTPGMDFGAYPKARTFTFGVNVKF